MRVLPSARRLRWSSARSSMASLQQRYASDWTRKSLMEASKALQSGQTTAMELTEACIRQIEATKSLNMFVHTDFDRARSLAQDSDDRRAKNAAFGPLDGIPIGVKDIFCMKDTPTTASSKMLSNFVAPYESTATANLLNKGAIPLGKLNMDEFAMGSATVYSYHGATINPWSPKDKQIVAGGSSGGSAAAIASGCCFAALGSDTGGSVRQPAAYCGVVGTKPSYGRISRHGMISYASSLDTPGVFTRTVADAAVVLEAMSGPDDKDSTCMQTPLPVDWCSDVRKSQVTSLEGVRIGVPKEYFVEELPQEIIDVWDQGIKHLKDAGATVVEVSLPMTKTCIPAYYIIACAEASSNLSRYDGVRYGHRAKDIPLESINDQSDALHDLYKRTRSEGFGDEVQRRILSGTFVLSAGAMSDYYERAVLLRQRIRQDFESCFEQVDALLTPTTPSGPLDMKEMQESDDPVAMYLNDVMTVPANMAGIPALSVPTALTKTSNLPLGLQVLSGHGREDAMLQVAQVLESQSNFEKYTGVSLD